MPRAETVTETQGWTTKASQKDSGRGKGGSDRASEVLRRAERAEVIRMEWGWEKREEAPGVLRPWRTWSSFCRRESREMAGPGSG